MVSPTLHNPTLPGNQAALLCSPWRSISEGVAMKIFPIAEVPPGQLVNAVTSASADVCDEHTKVCLTCRWTNEVGTCASPCPLPRLQTLLDFRFNAWTTQQWPPQLVLVSAPCTGGQWPESQHFKYACCHWLSALNLLATGFSGGRCTWPGRNKMASVFKGSNGNLCCHCMFNSRLHWDATCTKFGGFHNVREILRAIQVPRISNVWKPGMLFQCRILVTILGTFMWHEGKCMGKNPCGYFLHFITIRVCVNGGGGDCGIFHSDGRFHT